MKFKKIIFYTFIIISIFLIYNISYTGKINYIALGDSLAAGQYPYGNYDYGYTDYINDYFKENESMGLYVKEFAKSGYKIENIIADIDNNKKIVKNGTSINIKSALRESDLVTLSIGANDLKEGITINNLDKKIENTEALKNKVDNICSDLERLIKLIKKYAKRDIIIIGYYNPFPYLTTYKNEIDIIVKYSNERIKKISKSNGCRYIDIFDVFDRNTEYLPNPFDIHPNNYGYKAIFERIERFL